MTKKTNILIHSTIAGKHYLLTLLVEYYMDNRLPVVEDYEITKSEPSLGAEALENLRERVPPDIVQLALERLIVYGYV